MPSHYPPATYSKGSAHMTPEQYEVIGRTIYDRATLPGASYAVIGNLAVKLVLAWQPMETAPEFSKCLVRSTSGGVHIASLWDGKWLSVAGYRIEADGWMELPKP